MGKLANAWALSQTVDPNATKIVTPAGYALDHNDLIAIDSIIAQFDNRNLQKNTNAIVQPKSPNNLSSNEIPVPQPGHP